MKKWCILSLAATKPAMDFSRKTLFESIQKKLAKKLVVQEQAYKQARQASIQAEGAMQSRHDTTKEEMARLADVHLRAARKLEQTIAYFKKLDGQKTAAATVAAGALVKVREEDLIKFYLLTKVCGGLEITLGRQQVLVISTDSTIGQALLGQRAGSIIQLNLLGLTKSLRIIAIG